MSTTGRHGSVGDLHALRLDAAVTGSPAVEAAAAESSSSDDDDARGAWPFGLMQMMMQARRQREAEAEDEEGGREAVVATLSVLRASVEAHPALRWDSRLAVLAGETVTVRRDDPSDATSRVRFTDGAGRRIMAWLPTEVLEESSGGGVACEWSEGDRVQVGHAFRVPPSAVSGAARGRLDLAPAAGRLREETAAYTFASGFPPRRPATTTPTSRLALLGA